MNAMIPASSRQRTLRPSPLLVAAAALTFVAASIAWVLAEVAHLPENAVVLSVMIAAFIASWIVTNRRPAPHHQVTVIPVRVRINASAR